MAKKQEKGLKLDDPRKIFIFTVFATLTGIMPIDYYESERSVTFLITATDARKFKQFTIDIIRNISSELNKPVEVVIFSNNLERFVQNLFRPARVEGIIERELKGGKKALYVKVPVWDRGKALGRNSYKLYRARYFLAKYFGIEHVKIV